MTFILLGVLIFAFLMIRSPFMQTYLARAAGKYLGDLTGTEILIQKIRVEGYRKVMVEGFLAKDHHGEPFISIGEMDATVKLLKIRNNTLAFRYLSLDTLFFSLVTYEGEDRTNLDYFISHFMPDSSRSKTAETWTFSADGLDIAGSRFRLENRNREGNRDGIDFRDMDIYDIEIEMSDAMVIGDSVSANINWISANEKSGFELREFRTRASVSGTGIYADDLYIHTPNTTLSLDYRMLYGSYDDLSDFIEKVRIEAEIESSRLHMNDIGYFAPALLVMSNELKISGDFKGTVDSFLAEDFKFSYGKSTKFSGDITLKGLPDIRQTYADLKIRYLFSNKEDIVSFALPVESIYLDIPDQISELGDFKIEGRFRGYYNDFSSTANFFTDLGDIETDIRVMQTDEAETVRYRGDMAGTDFNMGRLLAIDELGTLDFDIEVEGKGITENSVDVRITGWVDSVYYQSNSYDKVILGGKFSKNRFNGNLYLNDELAELDFSGLVDFSGTLPFVDFTADIKKARLYDMNISKRAPDQSLEAKISASMAFSSFDTIAGNLVINKLKYVENNLEYKLDSLKLFARLGGGYDDSLSLVSDVAVVNIHGEFGLARLYPGIKTTFLGFLSEDLDEYVGRPQFTFRAELLRTDDLLEIFVPGLKIARNSFMEGYADASYDVLNVFFRSDTIEYNKNRLIGMQMIAEGRTSALDANIKAEKLQFREENLERGRPELAIKNLDLNSTIKQNEISWDLLWDDRESGMNKGFVAGNLAFGENFRVEAHLEALDATIDGRNWSVDSDNLIVVDSTYIGLQDFNLSTNKQAIYVDGALSEDPQDSLRIRFNDWRLSNFEPIIAVEDLTLSGQVDGGLTISGVYDKPVVFADLYVDSLMFNGEKFGRSRIWSDWIPGENMFKLHASIYQAGNISDAKTVNFNGVYYPLRDENRFSFDFELQNFQVGVLRPFLAGVFTEFKGYASGKANMQDTKDGPQINGSLNLMRGEFHIDYLGVTYSLSDKINFRPGSISFDGVTVFDPQGGKALVNGEIRHDFFRDFVIDLNITPQTFLGMKTTRYDNENIYGTVISSGIVRISGPPDNLAIDVSARSDKGTSVFIPIQYSVDVSQSDFIVFKGDTALQEKPKEYRVDVEGLTMNFDMEVTPDADIQIFLPSDMGYIKANGNGDLNVGIDSRGYFSIFGKYILRRGLFNFTLEQLVSKRFEIITGSSIEWTGDVYSAEINMRARYRTKTTLEGLGITLPEEGRGERVNVNLFITLTDNLFDPSLSFNIDFPYLSESMKQTVFAVLDTTDLAVMNQQAISLLILNSFSNAGSASASEINSYTVLSNQLSNLLSRISNDFDIGINYSPGDEITSEELEVALSTQLFDNRLVIDGDFDVPTSQSDQSSSNLVGDVNIEYKLTPDGNIRVKAFNRSNNLNTLEQYAPYTQGVGIFYRREFDNLGDLFRKKLKTVPEPDPGEDENENESENIN